MNQAAAILRAIASEGRWRRYLALAIVFALACAGLAYWQFWRGTERDAANAQSAANWNAPAAAVATLLPSLGAAPGAAEWRPALLHGRYLATETLAVRDRSLDGVPGYEVVVPFLLDDGRVFVVDRGFIRTSATSGAPATIPAPPEGEVTVTARLQPGEAPAGSGVAPPKGQIQSIDLDQIAKRVRRPTYTGAYGWVDHETPSVASMPQPLERPTLDAGMNFSYFIQWISFGVIAFVALAWAVRQDLKDAKDPEASQDEERTDFVLRRRRRTDAEIEDELLDASSR